MTAGLGSAAVLVAIIAYVAVASSPPPTHPRAGGSGTTNHSHSSSAGTSSVVTTTLPATTSTNAATTTTTLPAVSSTSSPPSTTSPTTTIATTSQASAVPPSDVLVEVLNGIGTPSAARDAARALHELGFLINGVGDAVSFNHTRNLIEYGPGSFADAETVAAHVSGTPQYREYSALQQGEVWVILGSTYDGVTP
ncbi:MAG: LytR C-terminal domain-containing protein [Acidimicrobiales bacterium]